MPLWAAVECESTCVCVCPCVCCSSTDHPSTKACKSSLRILVSFPDLFCLSDHSVGAAGEYFCVALL